MGARSRSPGSVRQEAAAAKAQAAMAGGGGGGSVLVKPGPSVWQRQYRTSQLNGALAEAANGGDSGVSATPGRCPVPRP